MSRCKQSQLQTSALFLLVQGSIAHPTCPFGCGMTAWPQREPVSSDLMCGWAQPSYRSRQKLRGRDLGEAVGLASDWGGEVFRRKSCGPPLLTHAQRAWQPGLHADWPIWLPTCSLGIWGDHLEMKNLHPKEVFNF